MSDNPYRAAGTFSGPAYTEREADRDLRRAIEQNRSFPYLLAPRQSGKSSLLHHLRAVLDPARFRCGFVDLSVLRWEALYDYDRFLARFFADLGQSLGIPSPSVQGLPRADLLALLAAVSTERVVILIDEVDALRTSVRKDDFFSYIRSNFNDREHEPELKRVQFVLAGAARVEELITDKNCSPFNVGESIRLDDFSPKEVDRLCEPLRQLGLPLPKNLTARLLYHTSGSPYLTQLILVRLWDWLAGCIANPPTPKAILTRVDSLVDGIVVGAVQDMHFNNIAQMMEREPETLWLWRQAVAGLPLSKFEWERLRITGLTGGNRKAVYRNRIYKRVFANLAGTAARLRRWVQAVTAVLVILIGVGVGSLTIRSYNLREQANKLRERTDNLAERIEQAALDVPTQAFEELHRLDSANAEELMAGYWDRRALEAEQTGTRDEAILLRLNARRYRDTPERLYAARVALDAPLSKMLLELRHEDWVRSARFSADGRKVVTASDDNTARIWDATTGEPLGEPLRHKAYVLSARFSANGRMVVTASEDKTARIWDATTGQPLGEPLRHEAFVVIADFSADGRKVVTASDDNKAWIWDAATGQPLGEPLRHDFAVRSASFSADGRMVVTASEDQTAQIWDAATGQPLGEPLSHNGIVMSARFSADSRMVVTASDDNTARIWNAITGQPVGKPLRHNSRVGNASFNADGSKVVTASFDKTAQIWDATTGLSLDKPLRHEDVVFDASFSADGNKVVTASRDNTARIWDATTGLPLGEAMRHENGVTSASFSADGSKVVTAGFDKTARIWDATPGNTLDEFLRPKAFVLSVSFSEDGRKVVTASRDNIPGSRDNIPASRDNIAQIWDTTTHQPIGQPLRHEAGILSASFSGNGSKVITVSDDNTARIWNATTGLPVGEALRHEDRVSCPYFSANGSKVVTVSGGNTARIWDATTGLPLGESLRHEDRIISARFSKDGHKVVTASEDKTARIWDATTGLPLGKPLRHEDWVMSASFSEDGNKVVTASRDNTARIWGATTGQPLSEFLRHENSVHSASFSADGRMIITASFDNTARIWDATTGQPLGKPLHHEANVDSASFSADGGLVVTQTESCIRWWQRTGETRTRLAGIRWIRGIRWKTEPWISRDGREVKAAEAFTGDSVVVRSFRLGEEDPTFPDLSDHPPQLLTKWKDRLALKFEDETRSPKLVPMYGLSSKSSPPKHALPDQNP